MPDLPGTPDLIPDPADLLPEMPVNLNLLIADDDPTSTAQDGLDAGEETNGPAGGGGSG